MGSLILPPEGLIVANASARSSGKTTNSACMCAAIAADDRPVQGFDADNSQQFARWAAEWDALDAEALALNPRAKRKWGIPVTSCPTQLAGRTINANIIEGEYAVVDCGHYEDHRDVGRAVTSAIDVLVLNIAPTFGDVERMRELPMKDERDGFLDSTALVRADGLPVPTVVLLTKVQPNTKKSTGVIRQMLTEDDGYVVLDTQVPFVRQYAKICEDIPPYVGLDTNSQAAHVDVLTEITEILPNLRKLQAERDARVIDGVAEDSDLCRRKPRKRERVARPEPRRRRRRQLW